MASTPFPKKDNANDDRPRTLAHAPLADGFRARILSDPPGTIKIPAARDTFVSIHLGQSVRMVCRRGGHSHSGISVHGDIDVIPPGTPSTWILDARDTALALRLPSTLMNSVAEQLGLDPGRVEIVNRFMMRDSQIENIGWAVKAEIESGLPSGRLYMDSLAVSLASRLLLCHSSHANHPEPHRGGLTVWQLKEVLSYIEDNLAQDISLRDVAAVARLSVSHFNRMFRESEGLPLHQYLIQRRVERAKTLLADGKLPISQIALESGFAHQSHLAYHMRRAVGISPRRFREESLVRKRKVVLSAHQ
ncbi:MAG TPA: AraC family transcriptional regulator [Blastocatellia bacterium]